MKLLINTETERMLAAAMLPGDVTEALTDDALATIGGRLTYAACTALKACGVHYERAHHQAVGVGVIVQSGTSAEIALWDAAIALTMEASMPRIGAVLEEATA